MPARISRQKESEIVRLYLQGASQTEIARKVDVSQSTVSKTISEFKEYASRSSLDEACSRRGVSSELSDLRSLSVDLRKAETTVSQAKRGCELMEQLTRLGANLDKLEELLSLCSRMTPEGLSTKGFVQAAVQMIALEKQSGKGYREIKSDYEDTSTRLNELRKKLEELNAELADVTRRKVEAEADLETRLSEHVMTMEKLEAATRIRKNLERAGLSLEKGEDIGSTLAAFNDIKRAR